VSKTSNQAKHALAFRLKTWHISEDGSKHITSQIMTLPQGEERRVTVRTNASEQRVQGKWEKTWWHLGTQRYAWEADASTQARPPDWT
jgi:hypothetical protein